MAKINDIESWRVEIQLAEKWKSDKFGEYTNKQHTGCGENIDYFDYGLTVGGEMGSQTMVTTLNLIHAIVKNIVPALYYQNPTVTARPKKREYQDTAPIVSHIMNHFYEEIDAEETNKKIIWDAYVLGMGVYKIGYATKFGTDIKDKERKPRNAVDKALEQLGLKKPPVEEETAHPDIDYKIISESPYIQYISPFDYGRDPRSTSLDDAMYWYHRVKRTIKQMKDNPKYKNTKNLVGTTPPDGTGQVNKLPEAQLDAFKTVDVYEIHYRNGNDKYLLVISDDSGDWREHYHEESIYEIDGWQADELAYSRHGHNPFPISDITKIKNLQDRFTTTIDSILEQVDRFVPKIAVNESDVTEEGMNALQNGDIGAVVKCTKNPAEIFRELAFTQLKTDLVALTDQIISIVGIQTGLTRAQLTGVSTSNTATEATIEQGGQTLRLTDMDKTTNKFLKRQAQKLWQIIQQFVDFEELELINGETGVDDQGLPIYNWLDVTPDKAERMITGGYDFNIELGSTQKPDLNVVRKQFENLFNILARSEVVQIMQQQGDKLVLSELLKMYLALFPEAVRDVGRILQKITPQTQGLLPEMMADQRGGTTPGSNFNALEAQRAAPIQRPSPAKVRAQMGV